MDADSTSPGAASRYGTIDCLRGIAVLAVVVHHIFVRSEGTHVNLYRAVSARVGDALYRNGFNGVVIFFVISGFVITRMTLRRWGTLDQIDLRAFYRFRFARIFPLLLLVLVALTISHRAGWQTFAIHPPQSLGALCLAVLTFRTNCYIAAHGAIPLGWLPLWSLAVEEVFYLFFPLVAKLSRRLKLFEVLCCALIVIAPLARASHAGGVRWNEYGYLACMDAIAMGCLISLHGNKIRLSLRDARAVRILGSGLMLLVTIYHPPLVYLLHPTGLDFTLLAAGTALFLLTMPNSTSEGSRYLEPLRWFGRNSYEIYLTHVFVLAGPVVLMSEGRITDQHATMTIPAIAAAAGVLGWLVARYYSEPLNAWLRRPRSAKLRPVSVVAPAAMQAVSGE